MSISPNQEKTRITNFYSLEIKISVLWLLRTKIRDLENHSIDPPVCKKEHLEMPKNLPLKANDTTIRP